MSYNLPDGCTEEMIDALYAEHPSSDDRIDALYGEFTPGEEKLERLKGDVTFFLKRLVHNMYVQYNEEDMVDSIDELLHIFGMNLPKTEPVITGKTKVSSLKQFAAALVRAEAEMVKKG